MSTVAVRFEGGPGAGTFLIEDERLAAVEAVVDKRYVKVSEGREHDHPGLMRGVLYRWEPVAPESESELRLAHGDR